MRVDVKICGLTREADARTAAALGARYIGVIFAGGPRNLDPSRAKDVLDAAGPAVDRVGVFGAMAPSEIARIVDEAHLDIVQLHADPAVTDVKEVNAVTGARIWSVVRVAGALSDCNFRPLWQASDGLVLDSKAGGALGGTGTVFHWSPIDRAARSHARPLVVAGGLTPKNVGRAIETLSPDIVDVSSGVESSPGIKDHTRMAEFMDAVERARVLR